MDKNYYFDMDGVVAEYKKEAYIGEDPLWLRKNHSRFFRRQAQVLALAEPLSVVS